MHYWKKKLMGVISIALSMTVFSSIAFASSGEINGDSVRVRKGAGTKYAKIDKLDKNTKVEIVDSIDGWYKIKYGKKSGWVSQDFVNKTDVKAKKKTSRSGLNKGEQIVDYAKRFLGVPYVYGGSTPDGFDCSGFIKHVFNSQGIRLERTAKEQSEQGWSVSEKDIKPGDLLFFDTLDYGRVSHVGMAIGNNKFIHASSGKSKHKVCISSLDEFYSYRLKDVKRFFE